MSELGVGLIIGLVFVLLAIGGLIQYYVMWTPGTFIGIIGFVTLLVGLNAEAENKEEKELIA